MKAVSEERRRFFRINDAIGVSYRLVDDGDQEEHEVHESVSLFSLLESQAQALQVALSELKKSQPLAANAISALDKKLDLVIALLEQSSDDDQLLNHHIHQASISACGIAFPVNEALPAGAQLHMRLFLEMSREKLSVRGRVIDCHSLNNEGMYYLRVEFADIQESDKEKLIQHIIQRQSILLRSLREQMED